jgi:hypothetical protein
VFNIIEQTNDPVHRSSYLYVPKLCNSLIDKPIDRLSKQQFENPNATGRTEGPFNTQKFDGNSGRAIWDKEKPEIKSNQSFLN